MKEPKSKHGKRFSEEFQPDAVRMLQSGERTAKQLVQELGVFGSLSVLAAGNSQAAQ
jgi:hypothetical protein